MPAVTICILQPYYAECMSGQAAERKVQKLAKKEYRKNEKDIYKILNDKGNEEAAIKCAENRYNQYLRDACKPSEMLGCTTVHLLVKEIKQALEKEPVN